MEFQARAEKAKAWYKRNRGKDSDPRVGKSLELASKKAFKQAVAILDRAIEERPDDSQAIAVRRRIVELQLWNMVDGGLASWAGGKPKGSHPPIPITPGPP